MRSWISLLGPLALQIPATGSSPTLMLKSA